MATPEDSFFEVFRFRVSADPCLVRFPPPSLMSNVLVVCVCVRVCLQLIWSRYMAFAAREYVRDLCFTERITATALAKVVEFGRMV